MVRTQIQLTEEQVKSLKRLANKLNVSLAELIRGGVDTVLRSSGEVTDKERKQRAIAAAGRFRSGKRDLSAMHDAYLAEAFNL